MASLTAGLRAWGSAAFLEGQGSGVEMEYIRQILIIWLLGIESEKGIWITSTLMIRTLHDHIVPT